MMMACIRRKYLPLFKLIKYYIVMSDEVYISFYFNIILNRSFIVERHVNIAYSYMAKTRKTKEHSDGINDKLQK